MKKELVISEVQTAFELLIEQINLKKNEIIGLKNENKAIFERLIDGLNCKILECQSDWNEIIKYITSLIGRQKHSHKGSTEIPFRVVFGDGTIIGPYDCSYQTYIEALEKVGYEKISTSGILFASEPLVSKNESDFKKYPNETKKANGNWFYTSHMNNVGKIRNLNKVFKKFGIDAKCEVIN